MRRIRRAAGALSAVVLGAALVAAPPAGAAPAPRWETVPTAPISGDTSSLWFEDVVTLPTTAFAAGWARHEVPGASEIRNVVERFDGTRWTTMPTPDHETAPASNALSGISAWSANDVWAVGTDSGRSGPEGAYTLHWDGRAWAMADLPAPIPGHSARASDIVSVSRTESWAVGSATVLPTRAVLWHRVGATWTSAALPARLPGCQVGNGPELTTVTTTPAGDVYASGTCRTPHGDTGFVLRVRSLTAWDVVTVLPNTSSIEDLDAGADGTVYGVGWIGNHRPLFFAVAGDVRTDLPTPPGVGDGSLLAIGATGDGITVGGAGPLKATGLDAYVATWSGGTWTRQPVTGSRGLTITALDGTPGRSAAWALGTTGAGSPGAAARPARDAL